MPVALTMLQRMIPMVIAGVLSGCASHHPPSSTAASSSGTKNGQGDMMAGRDMKAMCDNHKNMMSAKTSAEREAMMDQRMKSMSPEMRQQHMAMMDAKCK